MNFKNSLFVLALLFLFISSCVSSQGKTFAPDTSLLETASSTSEDYSHAQLGTLVFVIDVIRHGERTPEMMIPSPHISYTS